MNILIDSLIKLWVLLPISVVMVLVGILRTYITLLFQPSPSLQDRELVRQQQHLARLGNYLNNRSVFNSKRDYDTKLSYLVNEYSEDKYLKVKFPKDPSQENPANPLEALTSPASNDMLMQSVKASIANYVPQSVIMWWVNYFFKGYIIMKLPFDVTANFKSMLQTSINTPDLDASYVSSVSWYFVNLLGLKSVYALIFNDNSLANKLMAQQQQQPIQPQIAGAGPSPKQLFQSQLENLKIAPFESCLTDVTDRVVKMYK
ncbi:hypothetical protein FOA43_000033 [Brettanomyces nanus]|uniref:ER membrane protein complex subunit 3 n=1 Tax=Eeniella nana TaxID=13502 RepID=A0A875RXV8_EENNA|nr:uncharacterized protein FOA43_000033 [Brettanomyces nanus]QPG72732.1 hypothetical protein FOA43_000033 [Brettanomyces nanus]